MNEIPYDPNSITGNAARDAMIVTAVNIARNGDGVTTLPAIQIMLPGNFDLDEVELKNVIAAMDAPEQVDTSGVVETPPAPIPDEPQPEPPTMTHEEAQARIAALNEKLARLRAELERLSRCQRKARTDLAAAVQAFVTGQQPRTFDALVREELAANQQHRADVKAGLVPPRQYNQRGKSYIDRMSSRGGSAEDHIRHQLARGKRRFQPGDRMVTLPDGRHVIQAPPKQ